MTRVLTLNEFDGVHRWASCPATAPHNYLASPHRHRFTVECEFAVDGEDRALEIFEMQDRVEKFIRAQYPPFSNSPDALLDVGARSCEMVAHEICDGVDAVACTVREDGRGGARYVRE